MQCSRPKTLAALFATLAWGLGGCWQQAREQAPLVVLRTSPALGDPAAPVLLNDAITVYFSDELRGLSITPDSVTLLDELGHAVPGRLETGSNWVSFVPAPPLSPSLEDGSFRPGGRYRLQLAGQPRPDSIRSSAGQLLDAAVTYDVYVAERGFAAPGLPSILRPAASDLPFLMRRPEVPLPVASDAPRLQVHFTLPVLPSTVTVDAFRVQLLGSAAEIVPRTARVLHSPIDDFPGSTVELDLGPLPRDGDKAVGALQDGDWLSVSVRPGGPLTDYGGNAPLLQAPVIWSVVAGASVPVCVWPDGDDGYTDAAGDGPGFEVRGERIQPRVRVEAGTGALGDLRPQRDVTLRVGVPFDRGDGVQQVCSDSVFSFAAIDIPEGVTVTVDARAGPVRVQATRGVRISGTLALVGQTMALPDGAFRLQPVIDLVDAAPISIVAAGSIQIDGEILRRAAPAPGQSALLLASGADLKLGGALPLNTMLALESGRRGGGGSIYGVRGAARVYPVTFTYGVAPGASFVVSGMLPWRRLPEYVDGGVLQVGGVAGEVEVEWQATPADPIRGSVPDLSQGRPGRWQAARSGDVVVAGAGAFVRLRLRSTVSSDRPLPSIERLWIVEQR
ncbi:MAG: Ig-like domain-containing protein [Planctomycetota bacterium]|nr:Ig-like domain-containing protein [Planctomycetota bacterium]